MSAHDLDTAARAAVNNCSGVTADICTKESTPDAKNLEETVIGTMAVAFVLPLQLLAEQISSGVCGFE